MDWTLRENAPVPDHFEFDQEQHDGVRLIRCLGDPELSGWRREDLWGPNTPRFVGDYGMFQPAALLYPALLGVVWHLTDGLNRFALPVLGGVSHCERFRRPYELVRWKYGIEWDQAAWPLRDHGFVLAKSQRSVPSSQPSAWPRSERFEGAALTRVSTWQELMSVIPVGDQANTLCLFAIEPDDDARARLLTVRRADQPPSLETVLAIDDDVFAVITQEDEGRGLSSLLIAGRKRLQKSFPIAATQLVNRLDSYFSDAAKARTLEEWCAAVDRLADVALPAD